jgi:hypothetical protein
MKRVLSTIVQKLALISTSVSIVSISTISNTDSGKIIKLDSTTSSDKSIDKRTYNIRPRLNVSAVNASAFSLRTRLNDIDFDLLNDLDEFDDDKNDDTSTIKPIVQDVTITQESSSSSSSSLLTTYLARQFQNVAALKSSTKNGHAPVIQATKIKDVSTIGREVALVADSRGCSEQVVEIVKRTVEEAALADKHGLSFYLITDETPENVLLYLRQSLYFENYSHKKNKMKKDTSDKSNNNTTIPSFIIFDRAASTRNKFMMEVNDIEKKTEKEDINLPYPSDLVKYINSVVSGSLHPTLLGKPRRIADDVPLHPYVTQVVASSFRDLVLDPSYDVCLEAYLSNCPMCMCLAPRIRMLAQLAHIHFPHVKVAVMNVDENDRPMEWLPGPAFPTLQLFHGNSSSNLFQKQKGPTECSHAAADSIAKKANTAVTPIARTTFSGSSPCVPAIDFSHPSAPGKMALPSVVEMLNWVAINSSKPFDPTLITVDDSLFLNSESEFRDFLPPTNTREENFLSKPLPTSLLSLAKDMDVEAKVFEVAVFDLFYYEHMANTASKGLSIDFSNDTSNIKVKENKEKEKLDIFSVQCVERLRRAATDGAAYGTAREAYNAMTACSDLGEELGIRELAKKASIQTEEKKLEDKARDLLYKLA